jgi:hypothetical protein
MAQEGLLFRDDMDVGDALVVTLDPLDGLPQGGGFTFEDFRQRSPHLQAREGGLNAPLSIRQPGMGDARAQTQARHQAARLQAVALTQLHFQARLFDGHAFQQAPPFLQTHIFSVCMA